MFMQNDITAASADCGPRFDPPRIDPVQRSAEIETLLAIVNAPRAGLDKLSRFSLARAREDNAHGYFAQIRAARKRSRSGFEFRFDVPAKNTGRQDPERTADRLVEAARLFAGLKGLKPYHDSLRRMVDEAIAPASGGLTPMRVAALGLTPSTGDAGFKVTVDVEMLGDDLILGIDRVSDCNDDRLEERLKELVARHVRREQLRCQALASRAVGWLDDAASLVLEAAGIQVPDAIARLRGGDDLEFCFGGEEGWDFTASLFWIDGVIRAYVRELGVSKWEYDSGLLKLHEPGIPEVALAALPGRRMKDLMKHPFIPADALITEVHTHGDWVWIELAIGSSLIDDQSALARPISRQLQDYPITLS